MRPGPGLSFCVCVCLWVFLYSVAVSPAVSKGFLRNVLLPAAGCARRAVPGEVLRGRAAHGRGCGTHTPGWPCPALRDKAGPGPVLSGSRGRAGSCPALLGAPPGPAGQCISAGHGPSGSVPVLCASRAPRRCSSCWFCRSAFPQLCPTPQVKHSRTAAFPSVAKHYPCFYIAGGGSSGRKLMGWRKC